MKLFSFFALTFAWSWACWLFSSLEEAESARFSEVLLLMGGFGPSIAAVAVVSFSKGHGATRVWFMRCLQWWPVRIWMAFALVLPLMVMGLAAGLQLALGGIMPPSPAMGHGWLAAANFFLIFLFGGPLGEEFGWRGYALPELQARWGWRRASLLLGVVWAVWHLPLFYMAGTPQSQTPVSTFTASTIALSVLFAWLSNRTLQSVWPALVLHTAINAWPAIIPIMPSSEYPRPYQLVVGQLVAIAMGLFFCTDSSTAPES
jgi:hypothetical protein